ncbi:MAG: hypothetical protein AVO33_00785 [delta proteobacterium ML8_F1]|nr:MAG: hypothetical protein AVO33_00785 [delta proteobacterium ML8_F1]
MKSAGKKFNNDKGFGTIELVILIAILVGLALIFKTFVLEYTLDLIDNIKTVEINIQDLGE